MRRRSLDWIKGLFIMGLLLVVGRAHADPIKLKPIAVTASRTYSGSSPSYATDGKSSTFWNAGVSASTNSQPWPWIQLDLGRTVAIQKIRFQIAQTPAGTTGHMIYVGQDPVNLTYLTGLTVNSSDGQWLEYTCGLNKGCGNIRYVRIVTTQDPSWVAWREIEVYQGVEYFGYYADAFEGIFGGDYISQTTASGANLVWIGGDWTKWATKLAEARAAKARAILDLSLFFDANFYPYPDWEAYWAYLKQNFVDTDTSNTIAAFYLLDEPYNRGWSHREKMAIDLTKIANRVRQDTASKKIPIAVILSPMEVDCGPTTCPHTMFDWIGFDCYGPWDDGATPTKTCMNRTLQTWISMLRPTILPNQRMMAIPPGYEGDHWPPPDGPVPLPTEWDIVQAINGWQREVMSDPAYVAVIPFLWTYVAERPQVKARYNQFARSLLRSEPTIFPVAESASSFYDASTNPFLAFDGNKANQWNSGGTPTQWVAADLGGSTRVKHITVTTSQSPPGSTSHLIEGKSRGTWQPIGTLDSHTQDNQSLGLTGNWDISAIRVTTSSSPSWVGWREISFSR